MDRPGQDPDAATVDGGAPDETLAPSSDPTLPPPETVNVPPPGVEPSLETMPPPPAETVPPPDSATLVSAETVPPPDTATLVGAKPEAPEQPSTAPPPGTPPPKGHDDVAPLKASGSGRVPPRWIGGFRLLEELGGGGMGVVYRARSEILDRDVALKLLRWGDLASEAQRERFQIEARAAARLRHPNLIGVHEVGQDEGHDYLAMDFVRGGSLAERLERGPLEAREAARLIEQLAGGLAYAHAHQILHRDLKPANVLLGEEGEPILTDFGLAKVVDTNESGLTRSGEIMGTPAYMPPEQAEGDLARIDRRVDVYGLGATLYALLTGQPPFLGNTTARVIVQVLSAPPTPLSSLVPGIDRDLETICLKCLEKEPEDRYATAQDLADDLARYRRLEPILARRPSLADRLQKWTRRNTLAVWGLVGVVALLAVAGPVAVTVSAQRTRTAVAAEAQQAAEEAAPSNQTPAAALRALIDAERWFALDPASPRARGHVFRAGIALATTARERKQWGLAEQGVMAALRSHHDDATAHAAAKALSLARSAQARERAAEVTSWLRRARTNQLPEIDGYMSAVLAICRYPDPQTNRLVVEELDRVTDAMLRVRREAYVAVAEPNEAERAEGAQPIRNVAEAWDELFAHHMGRGPAPSNRLGDIRERSRIRLLARIAPVDAKETVERHMQRLQRSALASLDTVTRVCCAVLGRLGADDASATEAIARYLYAESEQPLGPEAGGALASLGTPAALAAIKAELERSPSRDLAGSAFALRVGRALSRSGHLAKGTLSDAAALRAQAQQAIDRHRNDEAIRAASRAIEQDPKSAYGYRLRASAMSMKGEFDAMWVDLERALELDPDGLLTQVDYLEALVEGGRLAEALPKLERARRRFPYEARLEYLVGRVLLDSGQPQSAQGVAAQLTTKRPRFPEGHLLLGQAEGALGRRAEAIAAFRQAVALAPRVYKILNRSGRGLHEQGRLREAIALFGRAIDMVPSIAIAYSNRAYTWSALGEHATAVADATRAIELNPKPPLAYLNRAQAQLQLGRKAEAQADLRAFLSRVPAQGVPRTHPGVAYAKAKLRALGGK